MEFDPNNHVIRLCMQGMTQEEQGNTGEAARLFLQAWTEAANSFEKYTAAYYIARHQVQVAPRLQWYTTSLQFATAVNSDLVRSALPSLYANIAKCYEELNDPDNADKHHGLARHFSDNLPDRGPFYHGTRADLQVGELLTAGFRSNYHPGVIMNHIYFTALVNGAGLAAGLAMGEGHERVYIVEPTGVFENDPNVTDKRFPGNPTRSYRSREPLRIVGELTEWVRQTPEQLKQWKERLAASKGDIIN